MTRKYVLSPEVAAKRRFAQLARDAELRAGRDLYELRELKRMNEPETGVRGGRPLAVRRKEARRKALAAALPADLRCPGCGKLVGPSSRRWVLLQSGGAECRSCNVRRGLTA